MIAAPCKHCKNRCARCHAVCEKYIAWRRERDDAMARDRVMREVEQVQIDNTLRVIRIKHRKER